MNKYIKSLIVLLALAFTPMKSWTQTPYRQYAEDGIVLNFYEIDNIDFRAFLLYSIGQNDQFVLVPEEEYGQFVLTPKDDSRHFMDEFEHFYQNTAANFALLTKNDISEQMNEWKGNIPARHFLSITMDVALRNTRTDNDQCINSLPFCTTDLIEFEAASTDQTANEPGMDDGCIGSSYNPSWYHMRIHTAGKFAIHMEGHDPITHVDRDIDFCMWGPYNEQEVSSGWACSNLSSDKIIDCCYSADETEDAYLGYLDTDPDHVHTTSHGDINYHLPEVGEYYILMITNYSRQPCVINFTKKPNSGPGETDCDILPGIVNNDGPYCEGETIHLTVNEQMNASYAWTGPNGFTSNEQNPVIPNCTLAMAGIYTCTTTVGSQNTTASTEVVVYQQATPSFSASPVCLGNPTVFNGSSTGENVDIYLWDFGDDETGNGQNVTHTYAQAGTYQVTLTVTAQDGTCPGEITQTVTVNAQPVADAGEDQTLPYPGTSAQLTGTGGSDSFIYQWEPANMVVNPNSPNTQTVTLYETQTYTLTVTNPQSHECVDTDQVTIYIGTSELNVMAEATPNSICEGLTVQLQVEASGGSNNFSYSWTPATGLSATNIPNPVATPTQTITYTCTVSDNIALYTQSKSVTVTVNHAHLDAHIEITQPDCDSVLFEWFGNRIYFKENGVYTFPDVNYPEGQTTHGCDTAMRVTVSNMEYTPHPFIESSDPEVEDPHYPITATEFNVNHYTYKVTDFISDISGWIIDSCKWEISKDSWRIVPADDNLSCTVYAMDWVEDTIWLSFRAVNDCKSVIAKYWLKPSFYGVEENDALPAYVSVIPNPNDGQMELRFDNMEGTIEAKVYNANGTLIDSFEIHNQETINTYNYTMKRLTNGVYFFTFYDGKKSITKKVVIIN